MKRFVLYLLFLFLLGNHCPSYGPAFRSKPIPLGDFFQDYWQEIDRFYWSVNYMELMKGKLYFAENHTVFIHDTLNKIVVTINKPIKNFQVSSLSPNWLLILDENSMLYLSKDGQSADSLWKGIESYAFSPFDTLIFYFVLEDSLKISYDGGISSQLLTVKKGIKDFKPDPYDPANLYLLNNSSGIDYLTISNDSGRTWQSISTEDNLDFILVDSNKVYGLSNDSNKISEFDKKSQNWTELREGYYLAVDIADKGLIGIFFIDEMAECWKREGDNWKNITIGIYAPEYRYEEEFLLTCEGNDYYMYLQIHRSSGYLYYFHDTEKEP